MRFQRIRDNALGRPPGAPAPESTEINGDTKPAEAAVSGAPRSKESLQEVPSKKRKADESEEPGRKRNKGVENSNFSSNDAAQSTKHEIHLPSRPATPSKTPPEDVAVPKASAVDEDEWAAFEADIAATEAPVAEDAVISAPAMSAADLAARSREEESVQRKERLEAEMEGEKEDAARKLEVEFEEMEELEMRLQKLKEKREALRLKESNGKLVNGIEASGTATAQTIATAAQEEDDSDDSEDDDWDGFRLR